MWYASDRKEMTMELRDQYRGSLLGLAVGDALGTTLEFSPPGSFAPLEEIVGGGPFALKPGEWTDDTSMALCLAASLVERHGFDARDQMQRYLRWRDEGYMSSIGTCFDIGGTVSSSLSRFEATGDPFAGSTHPHAAGNGSIMRLAPVPLFYASQPQQALEKAADSSRTTHGTQTAVDACRYLGALLVGAVQGASKEELLSPAFCPVPNYWHQHPLVSEIAEVAAGSFKQRQPPEIRGTGYVVTSLEAALWAFYHSTSFQQGCLLAVNLGDDADTTGAVYGQLAGAFYGEEALPQHWRACLAHRSLIESLADQLFDLSRMADAERGGSS
jgi:ADP-ribosyl-[dinitrogen reductase] hydrolase